MSVPQPLDNKYQFLTTNKEAEPTNKKVVELKSRQKQESMPDLVSCLLAAQIVGYWLEGKEYPRSPIEALNLLGIWLDESQETSPTSKFPLEVGEAERFELLSFLQKSESEQIGSLFKKLEIILAHYCQKYHYLITQEGGDKFLTCIEQKLDSWYTGKIESAENPSCTASLNKNWETLRTKLINKFEELVFLENQSSVGQKIAFLSETSSLLGDLEEKYEQLRARHLKKRDGYRRAYEQAFQSISTTERELIKNFELAQKSILNRYKFNLAAESCSKAASILGRLKLDSQNYLDYYKTSQGFLAEIKADFLAQVPDRDNSALVPFWVENSLSNYISLERLREQVERRLGRTLPTWGTIHSQGIREISALEVKEVLISELKPIAEQICVNTYERLKEEYSR